MTKKIPGVLTILTLCGLSFAPPILAQFSHHELEEFSSFGFEKPIQFWTTPRYNRVEGLFVNPGARFYPRGLSKTEFYAYVGGGFWNESSQIVRLIAGARKDFGNINRVSLGLEVFRKVDSEDAWIVGDIENSIAAFLFRDDFKDYYGATGFRAFVDHKFMGVHTLRLELSRRSFDPLVRNINWSVFGGDFRPNPRRPDSFIADGDEIGLKFIAAFDWRDNPIFPLSGWYVEAIFEPTFEDFETQGLFLTVKRFQQTWSNQCLFTRLMLGTRRGDIAGPRLAGAGVDSLADQYAIDLGGIGNLRGFDDKEFMGNRMFMLNFNYLFGGDILQKIPLQNLPVFGTFWTTLSLGVFVDTGWAWLADPDDFLVDGFGDLTLDNLKTNIGLSLLVLEGVFRLDVAKRTDRSEDDFRVTFRLLEKL